MVRGMAARRLVIVLLVLLGVAIFATALAPTKSDDEPQATTAAPPSAAAAAPVKTEAPPPLVLHAGRKKPEELPLEAGIAYSLDVEAEQPDTVAIPAFGLTQAVDPNAPAHFDILPATPGTFVVKLLGTGTVAGRLKVSPPKP
jgi:hypothetical protein